MPWRSFSSITQDEFMEKIKAERATYQAMLQKVR